MNVVRVLVLTTLTTISCAPGDLPTTPPAPRLDAGAGPGPGDDGGRPVVTEETPLEGCERFPTIGKFEQELVVAKCGTAACHAANGKPFAPDMKGLPIYPRLLDSKVQYVITTCDKERDLYIDSAGDPEKSYLVSKVRDAVPTCGSGRRGGARMPFLLPPLPPDEIDCFVSYVRALTGR